MNDECSKNTMQILDGSCISEIMLRAGDISCLMRHLSKISTA